MTLTLASPPVAEPVTLAEAKAHLRITHDAEDAELLGFALAARAALEARYGLAILSQGWRLALDRPPAGTLRLPVGPVAAVAAPRILAADGAETPLADDQWAVQTGPVGRLRVFSAPGASASLGGFVVDFTAGWPTPADVPPEIRLAVLVLAAHFYEHRDATGPDRLFSAPEAVSTLMAPWRRVRL